MTSKGKVYIVGVGLSPTSSAKDTTAPLVSATTKALLDAGITFDNVDQGIVGAGVKGGSAAFKAFDERDINVDEAKQGGEVDKAMSIISNQSAECILVITTEESNALSLIFGTEKFLSHHPYLKDSSALLHEADNSSSGSTGLKSVCQIVWKLRGWSQTKGIKEKRLHFSIHNGNSFDLSRSDGNEIPDWKDVEHKQDGKHRLGHNPANETREISQEDFEAVRAESRQKRDPDISKGFKRKGGDRAALARL